MQRLFLGLSLFMMSISSFSAPIIIGVLGQAAPFSTEINTNNKPFFYGFAIDVMGGICQKMQQECIYKAVTLESQLDALNNGLIDLLMLASPYKEDNLANYAKSIPYLVSKINFVGRSDNSMSSLNEIKNKKIGVYQGTFFQLLRNSRFNQGNSIIPFSKVSDLLSALSQKKIDLIVLNSALTKNYIYNDTYHIKIIGSEVEIGSGYGIIGLKDKSTLIGIINKAITTMMNDGTYLAIYKKYIN